MSTNSCKSQTFCFFITHSKSFEAFFSFNLPP
jgi:hypothetical protein